MQSLTHRTKKASAPHFAFCTLHFAFLLQYFENLSELILRRIENIL